MTADSSPAAAALSSAQYQALIHAVLSAIERSVDEWLQADVVDIDSQRSGNMLDLCLPDASHLIVNAQPPLQELWLAARAGGHHFRYSGSRWLDTRDGGEFFDVLSRHASTQAGMTLRFAPPDQGHSL